MITRFTDVEYQQANKKDKLPCECEYCHEVFYKTKETISNVLKYSSWRTYARFCSQKCFQSYKTKAQNILVTCIVCGKEFTKRKSAAKITERHFCSRKCFHQQPKIKRRHFCLYCEQEFIPLSKRLSTHKEFCSKTCAGKYQAEHKTHGGSRSKLEKWIELQLNNLYPNLRILYNDRLTIRAELDIYVPSLKLAFELNGIFHYEPIYGADVLSKIQNNDQRKFQACIEAGIELCIIDNTSMKVFNETKAYIFLEIITTLINKKSEGSSAFLISIT